eukprot:scaffold28985_cov31-Tisochrysis_lutea.AAC.4
MAYGACRGRSRAPSNPRHRPPLEIMPHAAGTGGGSSHIAEPFHSPIQPPSKANAYASAWGGGGEHC